MPLLDKRLTMSQGNNENKILDKRYRLGILPNAGYLELPKITRPLGRSPQPKTATLDDIDGSNLKVDIDKAQEASDALGTRDTTDNYFLKCSTYDGRGSTNSTVSPRGSQPGSPVFEKLVTSVKDNSSNLMNLIIVIVILVTEHLVKGNLFTCPCQQPGNVYYGSAFLAAPAVAFFVVGVMVNNKTWMLATGCLNRSQEKKGKSITSACHHAIGICLRALVAPIAWLIIGFIDGQFYVCAADPTPCEVSAPEVNRLRAESQLIGYVTMMVSMVLAIVGTIVHRSTRKLSYEQHRYVKIYQEVERQEMQEAFARHARERAKQNTQDFLASDDTMSSQTAWEDISRPNRPNQGWNTPNGGLKSITNLDETMKRQRSEEKYTPEEDDSGNGSRRSVKM